MPHRSLAGQQTDKIWPTRVNREHRRQDLGWPVPGTLDLGFFHHRRDRTDNALGHLILQIEDVAEPTIKPVCPKIAPVVVSISCPAMRTRLAALRTLPSTT